VAVAAVATVAAAGGGASLLMWGGPGSLGGEVATCDVRVRLRKDAGHSARVCQAKTTGPSDQRRHGKRRPDSDYHRSASLSFTASNDRALLQRGYLNVLDLGLCSHKAPMPHHSIPPHLQGGP
jgi:hypothetical protein